MVSFAQRGTMKSCVGQPLESTVALPPERLLKPLEDLTRSAKAWSRENSFWYWRFPPRSVPPGGGGGGVVLSSLVILPTPCASPITAPTAPLRTTRKVSVDSTPVSPTTLTVIVLTVSPAAKLTVPLAEA